MKPAQLRKWMQKYGNVGVFMVAAYLGMHFLWTRGRARLAAMLVIMGCLAMLMLSVPRTHVPESVPMPFQREEQATEVVPDPPLDPRIATYNRLADALKTAIRGNDLNAVKALLKEGADVNTRYYDKVNGFDMITLPLEIACDYDPEEHPELKGEALERRAEIVKLLVQQGAKMQEELHEDEPICFACSANQPELVKYLLASGMPADNRNENGWTPLLIAVEAKADLSIIRMLLAHGVDPNPCIRHNGIPVLMVAVDAGRIDTIRALIRAGANVNDTDMSGETSVLKHARESHAPDAIIRLLKRHGAKE
jgi:ankyrin repeat protein